MRKRRLSTVLAMALLGVFALTGCGSKVNAEGTTNDDTFVVGLEAAYPPFNWTQSDDSNGAYPLDGSKDYAGGYDVEIAKKIADGLGKELVVVKTGWDGLIPALQSGKIDAIIAGMSPTEERAKQIDFTESYYQAQLVLVVSADGAYANATTIPDFAGAKITSQLGTFHGAILKDQMKESLIQTEMEDFTGMRVALQSGVIDAYISERVEGISAQSANPIFKMIELTDGFVTTPEQTQVSVGLRKGSLLTSEINEILAGISEAERNELMENALQNQPSEQ